MVRHHFAHVTPGGATLVQRIRKQSGRRTLR
jgi:hypothetical protein